MFNISSLFSFKFISKFFIQFECNTSFVNHKNKLILHNYDTFFCMNCNRMFEVKIISWTLLHRNIIYYFLIADSKDSPSKMTVNKIKLYIQYMWNVQELEIVSSSSFDNFGPLFLMETISCHWDRRWHR